MGAFAGTAFGLKVTGSGLLGVAGILLASALAGGIWAGIAALLKNRARVNETVSTLLLNFVAVQVASYLVSSESLLQAPPGAQAVTPGLPNSSSLPTLMNGVGFSLSSGLVLALVLAIASVGLLRGTGFGFELRVLGLNPSCVESFGINRQRLVSVALVLSGATAGLAGGVMLSLYPGGVTPTFSGGVGWDGLLVALVSAYNPLAVVFASFGFGALSAGSQFVVASGVNATIAAVFQATVALAALLPQIFLRRTKTRLMALNAGDGGVLANPQVAPADPGRTPVPPVGVEHSAAAEPRRTGA
jgi:simple sugar transport system permease protein